MEIRTSEKFCILIPLSPTLDADSSLKLYDEIQEHRDLKIGLDLSYVHDCTLEFIEMLKNIKSVSLFNIPSDIFALINIMSLDKSINLFVNEPDFKAGARRLINRKFSVV